MKTIEINLDGVRKSSYLERPTMKEIVSSNDEETEFIITTRGTMAGDIRFRSKNVSLEDIRDNFYEYDHGRKLRGFSLFYQDGLGKDDLEAYYEKDAIGYQIRNSIARDMKSGIRTVIIKSIEETLYASGSGFHGHVFGENMKGGELTIHGNVGKIGPAYEGTITVKGDVLDTLYAEGATIIVEGNVRAVRASKGLVIVNGNVDSASVSGEAELIINKNCKGIFAEGGTAIIHEGDTVIGKAKNDALIISGGTVSFRQRDSHDWGEHFFGSTTVITSKVNEKWRRDFAASQDWFYDMITTNQLIPFEGIDDDESCRKGLGDYESKIHFSKEGGFVMISKENCDIKMEVERGTFDTPEGRRKMLDIIKS